MYTVSLERSEKSVLIDAINWYVEEEKESIVIPELNSEQKKNLNRILEELEKESQFELKGLCGSLILESILPEFGQEIRSQIAMPIVEDKEKTGDFYRVQFESIKEKMEKSKRNTNPFL